SSRSHFQVRLTHTHTLTHSHTHTLTHTHTHTHTYRQNKNTDFCHIQATHSHTHRAECLHAFSSQDGRKFTPVLCALGPFLPQRPLFHLTTHNAPLPEAVEGSTHTAA